eukprot:COSAG02_NODE_2529_length_8602_cov_20.688463_1_plen_390_part_00
MLQKTTTAFLLALTVTSVEGTLRFAKGGGMCAGMDDTSSDYKIYYGPCNSADTVATSGRPYFTLQITGMGMISGSDTDYLSDPATYAQRANPSGAPFSAADADVETADGSGTFAYVSASTGVGDGKYTAASGDSGVGGFFGAAFYLGQSGSISTNTNKFPAPDQESTHSFVACIGQITDGECGTGVSLSPGSLKFSLWGAIGGDNLVTAIDGKSYIAYRTEVGLYQAGDATVTYNDGTSLADLNGADVTSFTITKGDDSVSHVFPSTYNVGSTADCSPSGNKYICDTTVDNSYTRSVKIKASAVPGDTNKVSLDYLFAIAPSGDSANDGLNAPGRYFVYDPDVVEDGETEPEDTPPAAPSPANTESSGATAISCGAAVAFVSGIVALLA